MSASSLTWLAAEYHMPTCYSLRTPLSSANAASSLPAPGPGTVRLALVRTGIELFGLDVTRNRLFPTIRAADIRIKPPARVALTSQTVRLYKANVDGSLQESIGYREACNAQGPLTIFMQTPIELVDAYTQLLSTIGYWGQASGLACCVGVFHRVPQFGEYALPLNTFPPDRYAQPYLAALATELRDKRVQWLELMPDAEQQGRRRSPLRYDIYLWPLELIEQHSTHRLLRYRSIS